MVFLNRSTPFTTGVYNAISRRFIGFLVSGRTRPRISKTISTGASVIERNAAKNIAKVLVKASGLKSLPS